MAKKKATGNIAVPNIPEGKAANAKNAYIEAYAQAAYNGSTPQQATQAARNATMSDFDEVVARNSYDTTAYRAYQNGEAEINPITGRYELNDAGAKAYADRVMGTIAQNTKAQNTSAERNYSSAQDLAEATKAQNTSFGKALLNNVAIAGTGFAEGAIDKVASYLAKTAADKNRSGNPLTYLWNSVSGNMTNLLKRLDEIYDNSDEKEQKSLIEKVKETVMAGADTLARAPEASLGQWLINKGVQNVALPALTGSRDYDKNAEWATEKLYNLADYLLVTQNEARKQSTTGNKYLDTGLQAVQQAARMVPSTLVSAATGNPELGLLTMSASAGGSAAREAYEKGATADQAYYVGVEKGAVEYLTEKMFGGIEAFGSGILSEGLKSSIGDFAMTRAGRILTKTADILGENVEEAVSDYLDPMIDKQILGSSDEEKSFMQSLLGQAPWSEEGVVTLLTTFLMNGVSSAVQNRIAPISKSEATELIEIAKSTGNKNLINLANEYEGIVNRRGSLGQEQAGFLQKNTERILGGEEAYTQRVIQRQEEQRRIAEVEAEKQKNAETKQGTVNAFYERLGIPAQTGTVNTANVAAETADGEQAVFTGITQGEDGTIRARIVRSDGTESTVSMEDVSLPENVREFAEQAGSFGKNAAGVYRLYESDQDAGRYLAGMDEAINLYAANGVNVIEKAAQERQRAEQELGGAENSSTLIADLTPAQLQFAQAQGNAIYQQKVQEAKTKSAQYTAWKNAEREADKAAKSADSVSGLETAYTNYAAAVNAQKQVYAEAKAQYDGIVQELSSMEPGTEEYRNLLKIANELADRSVRINEEGLKLAEKRDAAKEKLDAAKKAAKPIRRKKGTVSFGETDVKGNRTEPIDQSKLTRVQKNVVAMVETLADSVNIDYVIYNGNAESEQGAYQSGGKIYLNINAGMAVNKSLAAETLSHELTHFMQEYAPEEYQQLKDFVAQRIGADVFEEKVRKRVSEGLSYDAAVDEAVANACTRMLRDSKAVTQLARENMTLAEKIADVIDSIVQKITAAFEDSDSFEAPFYKEARSMQQYFSEMQKLWDDGLVEATENYNAAQGMKKTAPESGVKYQVWDEKNGIETFSDRSREAIEQRGNAIAENETDLAFHVSKAMNSNEQQTVYIGGISDDVISKIEEEIGRSIRKKSGQYVYGITYDSIRHLAEHFDSNDSIRSAINKVASMPADHDSIRARMRGDKLTVTLEKEISGRNYLSVNIAATNKRTLDLVTAYITGTNKNRSLSTGDTSMSAVVGASASADTIADSRPESKKKFQKWDEDHPQLIAVHNKSVNGLRRMLERNGVLFPSIAIKKAGTNHVGFGDVSIVFPRSTIDPAENRWNRLYSNDAWTPTEPPVEYDVGSTSSYQKQFRELIGNDVYDALRLGGQLEERNLEEGLRYLEGDVTKLLMDYDGIRYAYLKEKGENIEIPTRKKSLDGFGRYKNDELLEIFREIDGETIRNLKYEDTDTKQRIADVLNEKLEKEISAKYEGEKKNSFLQNLRKKPVYDADSINIYALQDAFRKYEGNGNTIPGEVDGAELRRTLQGGKYRKLSEDPDFRKWVQEEFKDLVKDKGIPNGKGIYTDSGNRRSFKRAM